MEVKMKKYENCNIDLSGCYNDCANCSSQNKCCSCFNRINLPVLNREEIIDIKKYVKINDFYDIIDKNVFLLKTINDKCIFYKDGKCTIYKVRPTDCRLFPYDIIRIDKKYYLVIYEMDCIDTEKFISENYCDEDLIKRIIPWIKDFTNDINYTKMKNYKCKIIREINVGDNNE